MTLAETSIAELPAVEEYCNRSTNALTEDLSDHFAPAPDTMTTAQQVAHAALVIDWFMEGAFRPEGFDIASPMIGCSRCGESTRGSAGSASGATEKKLFAASFRTN